MAEIQSMHHGSDDDDDALLHQLFDLTCKAQPDGNEVGRVAEIVYARLMETYGGPELPSSSGSGAAFAG